MKHPVLMFLIVGALLFGADAFRSQQNTHVVVDAAVRQRLSSLWLAQTGKPISPEELAAVVQNWVKDEVFYREAMALGLDKQDSIIRRRLVQKLNFLIDEGQSPSAQQLQAFYQQNIARYTLPPRFSFSQILLADAAAAGSIKNQLGAGTNWRQLSKTSMLADNYVSRSKKQLASSFGGGFIPQLDQLTQGQWVGPINSSFGAHLIRLEKRHDAQATPLAYIEKKVLADFKQHQLVASRDSYYQNLLAKYDLVVE